MNPFQKNPFVKTTNTKIVGYNKQYDEKEKIENIKETMGKLRYQPPLVDEPEKVKPLTVKEKIDILKNIK